MIGRRIIYAIVFIGALAAFIATDSAAALFVCVFMTAFIPLSFVSLAIAAKGVRFEGEVREACMRGGSLSITMKISVRPRFFVGAARVDADIENTTFLKTERVRMLFKDLSFSPHTYEYLSEDAGRIVVRFKTVKLVDMFGICALNIKYAKYTESSVSPLLYENLNVTVSAAESSVFGSGIALPKKGSDPSEIFNVRDYVPGDSLHSVHWKLSSKFDDLKTKEFGSTEDRRTLILVDMSRNKFGADASDEQLNGVLDAAVSVSESLKEGGFIHTLGWFDEGEFRATEVTDDETFLKAVYKLMSIKVTPGNSNQLSYFERSPYASAFTKIIFFTTDANANTINSIPGTSVTAVSVGEGGRRLVENGFKILDIDKDNIGAELAAHVL